MEFSYFPFIIVLGLSLAIGFFFSKKSSKESQYFLGDRSLGWFPLAMTFIATQIGGGFILGSSEAAYDYGIFGIFYPLGAALGFLALGLGFGAKLRSLEVQTVSDLFEKYYGSISLKKCSSLLSILCLTGILIGQAVALKKFLFSMGLHDEWVFLLAWSAVILYTAQGGFLAVVWTDTLQAAIMLGMLLVTFIFTFTYSPPISSELLVPSQVFGEGVEAKLLGYLVMPFLFMFIEQDLAQRCFAGKSQKTVTKAALVSAAVLLLFSFVPAYFGMLASGMGIENAPNSKFMEVVIRATNGPIASCAATAILLAIISTASSLLCAVSSNLSQDFGKISSGKARVITVIAGVVALLFPTFHPTSFLA